MQFAPYSPNRQVSSPDRRRFVPLSTSALVGLSLFFLPTIPISYAEFSMNFIPDDGNYSSNDAYVSCGMSYISNANCGAFDNNFSGIGSHIDNTAFYQRMFSDGAGNQYYQVIVGDYQVDNFAQEFIIKANGAVDGYWEANRSGNIARSASAGDSADRLYNMTKPYDTAATDPLKSGTGTGNPTRVIMNMVLKDAESNMIFLKDTFANKPLITQDIVNSEMSSIFSIDMRAKDHNDITPITMDETVNTLTLTGADRNDTDGDFDIKTDSQAGLSNISAGGYTYTPGTGFGESDGVYTYWNEAGGDFFDPSGLDYADMCDANQNPDWSGNGACKNDDGTGGGGGGGWGGGGNRGGRGGFGW